RKTKPLIKIASQNMRGKGKGGITGEKWQDIHLRIKEDKIGILLLQEAHLTEEEAAQIEGNYRRLRILTSPTPGKETSAGGVACVVNTELIAVADMEHRVIVPGRAASISIPWHGERRFTILNIYAPAGDNNEKLEFFQNLNEAYAQDKTLKKPDYMVGDFNVVEKGEDRSSGGDDDPEVVDALWELKLRFGLQDAYRVNYPDTRNYTWRAGGDDTVWARLDRGYIATSLIPYMKTIEIHNAGITSDHLMLTMDIEGRDAPYQGPGRWAMPLDLLDNIKITRLVETLGRKATSEIENIEQRTEEHNAQIILNKFKIEVKSKMREYDK
ncbi:DNase I-like protein, partial [Peniophora sp. CONT]